MDLTELQIVELDMFLAFPDREDAINLRPEQVYAMSSIAHPRKIDAGKKLMQEVYKCEV